METEELAFVAAVTGASRVERFERIQALWGGYGELVRVELAGGERPSAIVKRACPPPRSPKAEDASHARKCRSYDVETAFYRTLAARCDESCRVAALLGARAGHGQWLIVLEDLDEAGFPHRSRAPRDAELDACLAWLAAFHARFVGERPEGLWKVGTYWHLATRQAELARVRDPALRARAPELDRQLREARYATILHGDAKPANFCFAAGGRAVAAVDFQYAGGGPGIKDVAYLLHGSGKAATTRALDVYFARLRAALPARVDTTDLEREWRALHPIAVADFERFLAGWQG